jgi:hypothetical protein
MSEQYVPVLRRRFLDRRAYWAATVALGRGGVFGVREDAGQPGELSPGKCKRPHPEVRP